MNARLLAQVDSTIRRHEMMRSGERVGIAVSGGADSVALALRPEGHTSEQGNGGGRQGNFACHRCTVYAGRSFQFMTTDTVGTALRSLMTVAE